MLCSGRRGRHEAAQVHHTCWRRCGYLAARRASAAECEDTASGHPFTGRQRDGRDACCFSQGIRDLGYVEGQTIVLDFRLSKGDYDAFPELAVQLISVPVDVIVTDTTSATQAAASATRTLPIVMAASGGDPVALGSRRA